MFSPFFLGVHAGIILGGSVFINHYTSIFLVFTVRKVQHVLSPEFLESPMFRYTKKHCVRVGKKLWAYFPARGYKTPSVLMC